MKKAYLTLSLAVILLGGFLMNPSWGEAQNQCTVSSATFTQPEDNSFDKKKSTLNIKTNGCEYTNLSVVLKYFASDDYIWTHQIKNLPGILKVASDGDLTLEITLGEDPCWSANKDPYGFPCVTFIEVYQGGNLKFSGNETYGSEFITKEKVKLGKNDPNVLKDYRNKGVLIGECSSTLFCKEGSSNVWELSKLLKGTSQQTQSCIINPNDIQYGELPFEKDSNGNSFPTITNANLTLNINTTNCKGLPITLSIYGTEGKVDIKVPEKGAVTEITKTAVGDELKFSFKTHDEECSIQKNPHCQFGTTITQNGTPIVSTQNLLETIVPGVAIDWNYYRNNGVIFAYCSSGLGGVYYCERLGANDWTLLKVSGSAGEDTPEVFETITPKFDPESPCFVQELNGGNGGYDEDCYELLAPVPGLKGATDPLGNNRWSINLKNFQIGDYVNSLFSIALGILTLLAVIMIVIAGVQYMTIESFQGKSDAKSRITGALTGLLLALSIYIILGTINPDLLQVNFGSNIEEVALEGYDPPTSPYFSSGSTGSNYNINAGSVPTGSASQYLANSGVYCPKQGGRTVVKQVAESFQEKVSYRYGGRFNDLGQSFPSHWKGSGKGYNKNTSCQVSSGTLCLDCSAFVATVLYCSGITEKPEIGTTTQIFQNSEKINQLDKKNGVVNGVPLQPGDLIGGKGHVGIYIGNGMVAESTSDKGGRNLNKAIKIRGMDGNWFGIGKKGGYVVRLNKLSGVKLN
ncbi:MAG: NlpC/P60 family protein [Candidatus Pacebacteria bacterium]|nr:NlpC/P60 family protein [Candidatus Paceibacterota bacterium]